MAEHEELSEQRLHALSRYIRALELGDVAALAALLNQASRDPVLSALLAEVDAVYQEHDGTTVSKREAWQAFHSVLSPARNGHLARMQRNGLLQQITLSERAKRRKSYVEEQGGQLLTCSEDQRRPPERPRSRGSRLQLLIAVLIVSMLVGSMTFVLYRLSPERKAGMGSAVPTSTTSPVSSGWGKTLYQEAQRVSFLGVAWSPDSQRVAVLTNSNVQVMDATTGAHPLTIRVSFEQFGYLNNMAWSPNGRWLALAADNAIVIVDAQTGALLHYYSLAALAFRQPMTRSPLLAALMPASGGMPSMRGVAWSPDSNLLAVTGGPYTLGGIFVILKVQTGQIVHRFSEAEQAMIDVASWSPDGKYLATRAQTTGSSDVQIWDTSTYQMIFRINKQDSGGWPVDSSQLVWQPGSDNLVFSVGNISSLRHGLEAPSLVVWDVPHNRLLKHYDIVNTGSFAWSPDGIYLATGSYKGKTDGDQVAVINMQNGQQIYAYQQHDYQITFQAWSPDGRYIASTGSSTLKIWSAP